MFIVCSLVFVVYCCCCCCRCCLLLFVVVVVAAAVVVDVVGVIAIGVVCYKPAHIFLDDPESKTACHRAIHLKI